MPSGRRWNSGWRSASTGVCGPGPVGAFQRPLSERPTLERCVEEYYLQLTRFESIAPAEAAPAPVDRGRECGDQREGLALGARTRRSPGLPPTDAVGPRPEAIPGAVTHLTMSTPAQPLGTDPRYSVAPSALSALIHKRQTQVAGDDPYEYPIDQCDVENRSALIAFRQKRCQWLSWLKTDEHHAISPLISSMAWNDVVFRTIWRITEIDPGSGLYNPLLAEALIEGHFAIQVLAIRRLMDRRRGIISLWRLLEDIKKNISLFTRENFVAYDGLPYDYEATAHRVMVHLGWGPFWAARSGPDAHWPSKRAHEVFDRLARTAPASRSRTDRVPKAVIDTLFGWLTSSEADQLVEWSHAFLAHAADRTSRQRIDLAAARPSLEKISSVLRCFVRVAEAVQGYVLFDSGHGMIVPTPQFNQFDRLASPLLASGGRDDLGDVWEQLAKERDGYLEGTFEALVA
jgi:hypothetical protein